MKLYFQSDRGEYRLISNNVNAENVFKEIKDYIYKLNPNFKIYYTRTWTTPDGMCFDVGSHTEFFYMTDKDLNK